jgi:hypothetical protein
VASIALAGLAAVVSPVPPLRASQRASQHAMEVPA